MEGDRETEGVEGDERGGGRREGWRKKGVEGEREKGGMEGMK